jgi:hypothetical protein
LQGTMPMVDPAVAVARPPRGLPNPTAAAFLGLIPGVGAFYNGQYQKGVIHVVMFIGIIAMTDRFDYFGFAIPLFIAYMIWDAYQTAKARITGEPVPDALGINNLFGLETSVPQSQDQAVGSSRPPVGAIVLIGLGILFLLGDTYGRVLENYWPILLIAIGLWKGMQRWQVSQ